MDGGWVPLLLASIVYGVMWIWHRGAAAVHDRIIAEQTPLTAMAEQLHSGKIARVPGSAVFFTRAKDQTPPVMVWHVRQNRALHETVLALTLTVLSVPWTDPEERLSVARVDDKFWQAEARRGFMEHPDIPEILAECKAKGAEIDLDDVTFYVGSETIVPREDRKGLPRWQEAIFAAWAATPRGSATISTCPATRSWKSGGKSRFEAGVGFLSIIAGAAAACPSASERSASRRFRPPAAGLSVKLRRTWTPQQTL